MARLSMLIDLTRCIGCDACTVSCKQENGTPADVFFARVLNVEAGAYPNTKRVYIPVLCNHCENPACLKACPNKAIYRREDGIVLIDQDRCRGTGACVSACPYGNIVLTEKDAWYLPDDRAYERDFVKPRLNENVARKCTLCAQRVDHGLEPACVVSCPTTARIFGDMDDPDSKISRYITEQEQQTGREAFQLLPEAGTEPATRYLGTMASQQSSTLGQRAPAEVEPEPVPDCTSKLAHPPRPQNAAAVLSLAAALLFSTFQPARAEETKYVPVKPAAAATKTHDAKSDAGLETWPNTSCAGCHGPHAMGGLGPPLAETKMPLDDFLAIVRQGKGMMPATPANELSDADVAAVHGFTKATALNPDEIPLSFKIGALLSTRNVGIAFSFIGTLSLLLALKVLAYWIGCAGWKQLRPSVAKFGYGKAAVIVLRSLIMDGLLVSSLWKKSKHRWAMHGLLLYGFLALGAADFLMNIFNPLREGLSLTHPLKLLANGGGLAVLLGVVYVRIRYQTDEFIDNGLTLGRDYLFLNLLTLSIVTGFITEWLGYAGGAEWILPIYLLHLSVVATLMLTAPYTRFQHVFVVPALIALTKLTAAVAQSGVELGFEREPAPGRHHKSERIALGVLQQLDPDFKEPVKLRYYP